MVLVTSPKAASGAGVFLQHVVDINPNRVFVNQPAAEIAGNGDQQATEQRQIKPLRHDVSGSVRQSQQPVEGSQRQQHHCQHGVTPAGDQASNLANQQQIHQPGGAGQPATNCAYSGQPDTGSGPERISTEHKCQISGNQTNQCGYREMNKSGVQRMTENFNLTDNWIHRHNTPQQLLTGASKPFFASKALFRKSLAVFCSGGLLLTQSGCSGPFSSLDPQGPAAAEVAMLWWLMFGFFSLVLLTVIVLWHYAIKRRANDMVKSSAVSGWIIWGGLALPIVSIIALLLVGVPVGQRMIPLEADNAVQINITGHQWYWQVNYPDHDIQLIDTLHIPVNTVVHLHLSSADVIHSFWVPRLGVKLDLIPGRTNVLRLEASAAGIYRGQCAEYCGVGHAHMQFTVIAYEQAAFTSWLNTFKSPHLYLQEKNTDD